MSNSSAADTLEYHLRVSGITGYTREYKFHPRRKWPFDFAWADERIAVEVDGGNRMATINKRTGQPVAIGRHTKDSDMEKLNEAAILGWRVLHFSPKMVNSGEAISVIERALGLVREVDDGITF